LHIGKRLTDAKVRCGHGNWLPWLEREFGWKERANATQDSFGWFLRSYGWFLRSYGCDVALTLSLDIILKSFQQTVIHKATKRTGQGASDRLAARRCFNTSVLWGIPPGST
jgi:hypothetical protein